MDKTIEDLFWEIFHQKVIGLFISAIDKYRFDKKEARLIILNMFQMMWRRRQYFKQDTDEETLKEFKTFLELTLKNSCVDFHKLEKSKKEVRASLKTTRVLLAILEETRIPLVQVAALTEELQVAPSFVDYLTSGEVPKGMERVILKYILQIRIACHQPAVSISQQADDSLVGLLRKSPVLYELLDHRISEILNGIFWNKMGEENHFQELVIKNDAPENLAQVLIGDETQLKFVRTTFDQKLEEKLKRKHLNY